MACEIEQREQGRILYCHGHRCGWWANSTPPSSCAEAAEHYKVNLAYIFHPTTVCMIVGIFSILALAYCARPTP